ncbi:hypothetical protein FIBSPDRAFT_923225 [Athelia psychrophila]|uniref:Probable RNA polymerase II nuclear localization protein SLC7A6OS n=1 Tax=Athelia psychrophila TaxID=1759441 RepID=A0A167VNT1_9AGAM|nr:hypothetical protein FIBSPDRAFT_923225 [Fibularhizoctonia sp. CBS 109695]
MDVDAQPGQPFTILRIKRKRNEEPLDALVVESRVRKKRSRKGLNVFQFAQTVEEDTWEDEKRRKDLQEQISIIAKARAAEAPASAGAEADGKPPSPTVSRPQKGDPSRRYTIVKQEEPEDEKPRLPTAPPKVLSHKDVAAKAADFKMYDAILSGAEKKTPSSGFDSDMDKFLPMLSDYLKIHDMTPPGSPSLKKPSSSALPAIGKSDDDYVWDVFYHRPASLSEWNAVAANVGTLTGLPPSITNPYDSDSDSEPEDEADEDSNGEEYYKNEYPDEEESSSGSDMFHDGRSDEDDNDDLALGNDSFDEDEWSRRA